eukprot:c22814_g1_i3 orf=425-1408(-)
MRSQQEQTNNDQHESDMKKRNDQQACSPAADHHEKKERSHDHEHLLGLPTSTFCNVNIKSHADCKIPCKSLKNSPHPYTTLHATLSHLINYNDPSRLPTQEAHNINPLVNAVQKPVLTDHHIAEAAIYKGLQSHIIDDQSRNKGSGIRFQHFPYSEEASDGYNNSITAASSSYSEMSTLHLKNAAVSDHGTSTMIQTRPFNYPSLVSAGDYCPPASFDSVKSLSASHAENDQDAADIKPPEGLQSVIWSFLNRQDAVAPAAAGTATSDHFKAQYHQHHYINPNMTTPLSLDHNPSHQLPVPDQYTIEALSSSAYLQYLQAQLADCFS